MPVRVLIVDDSAIIRLILQRVFAADPRLEVVGMARDAYEARALIKSVKPDVLTLDVEMPRMTGLEFLERLMRLRPMPVVMFSSVTPRGSEAAIKALSLGAFDCIPKPADISNSASYDRFCDIVFHAGSNKQDTERLDFITKGTTSFQGRAYLANPNQIILIGASTGGVAAIECLLSGLPEKCPPVVIVQHMISDFLTSFADRLDRNFPQHVGLASDGMCVGPGQILIAPGGDRHTTVHRQAGAWMCKLQPGDAKNGHRPSVDSLFQSAVSEAKNVVAVLLTGLGVDGAAGLTALHKAGATTIAQDAETCVVHGMPRAAQELGGVDETLPIKAIGGRLSELTQADEQSAVVVR